MCAAKRPCSSSLGSPPSCASSASPSECAGSVDTTSALRPDRASSAAVAAASVVFPTPPLPVNSTTRTVPKPSRPPADPTVVALQYLLRALDVALEALQSGVDDDLLRLAAQHPDHRDVQLDAQR